MVVNFCYYCRFFNDANDEELLKPTEDSTDLALKYSVVDIANGNIQLSITATEINL